MEDIEQIKNTIKQNRDTLEHTYQVKNIGIFGSFVHGDNIATSDIDILIELTDPIGFFEFIKLEDYLTSILKRKVDLTTKNALKIPVREDILKEVVYV